ncbi:MAG: hypothetical protein ACFFBY_02210 [Promethearchaeota archaeon]
MLILKQENSNLRFFCLYIIRILNIEYSIEVPIRKNPVNKIVRVMGSSDHPPTTGLAYPLIINNSRLKVTIKNM